MKSHGVQSERNAVALSGSVIGKTLLSKLTDQSSLAHLATQ